MQSLILLLLILSRAVHCRGGSKCTVILKISKKLTFSSHYPHPQQVNCNIYFIHVWTSFLSLSVESSSPPAVNTDSLVLMDLSLGSSSTTPEDSASDSGLDTANTLRYKIFTWASLTQFDMCGHALLCTL